MIRFPPEFYQQSQTSVLLIFRQIESIRDSPEKITLSISPIRGDSSQGGFQIWSIHQAGSMKQMIVCIKFDY